MLLELSIADKQLINKAVSTHSAGEVDDRELFLFAYKAYKGVKKVQRGAITTVLNKEVEKSTKSTNIQRALKRVFKVSLNYCDMRVIANFDKLEYTNISKLVGIFKYLDKNFDKPTVDTVREEVASIKYEGVSPYRYNNNMTEKIAELKAKYKLQEVEDEFKVIEFMQVFNKHLTELSKEDVLKMLDSLTDRLDVLEGVELHVA